MMPNGNASIGTVWWGKQFSVVEEYNDWMIDPIDFDFIILTYVPVDLDVFQFS